MGFKDIQLSTVIACVLWLFTLEVEAGVNDCRKTNSCWSRETSIIVVSVVVSTVCLAFIIGIIVTIWCCCFRKGGGLIRRKSDTWRYRSEDNNVRLAPVGMWPQENTGNVATQFNRIDKQEDEERLKLKSDPPSYDEVMTKDNGGDPVLTSLN